MAEANEIALRVNPFRETIVATPWGTAPADVDAIHGKVFEECLRGIQHVRRTGRSASLLIHGAAGAGKTHLLRRLRARLAPQAPSSTYRQETLFVWVRLQTSPRMIWRTVRRTLVDDWFRPVAAHRSQFERILFHRFAEKRPAEGDLERWYEYMLDEVPDGLKELLDEIATDLDLDRNTAIAFEHIAFRRHLRDLRAWLGGASLPESALARMDLAQDEGTDEEQEDQSKQVVQMLCRLAGSGLPVVLCFDQVEALQLVPGDKDGLFAFGQLTSTIHDGASNALIISCMQSSFFGDLKENSRGSDYDRMSSLGALSLDPLSSAEARQLIAARIQAAGDAIPPAARESATWPLDAQDLDSLFSAVAGSVTPRRLLSRCAERFDVLTRDPPIDSEGPDDPEDPTHRFLADHWRESIEKRLSANNPGQTEEIVRHALPLVVGLIAPECAVVREEQVPDVSLVFERAGGRTGVSVCTQSNMTSLAGRLRRLKGQFGASHLQRLVIVRDDRVPISAGAKTARKYLEELQQQNALVVHPSAEVLAALDALRVVLSDAKSGDLAYAGETIAPRTVEEWLKSQLPGGLRDFVDEILGNAGAPQTDASDAREIERLSSLLMQKKVVSLHDAALTLGSRPKELASVVERHPNHFGLLGDPPEILFRVVESGEPAGEAGAGVR